MKKLIALMLALVLCTVCCGAFAETDAEYVKARGTLVVGITDFAPMDYRDADGNWIGVDAELAAAFAESLGVKVEFVEIDWDNKILELNSKAVDCIWNGMTLTDEVMAAMNCTVAYLDNSQVIVMKSDKLEAMPEEINADDVAGLVFAVEAGSAGAEVAAELGLQITEVTSQAAALMEVAAGTSDAAVIDLLMASAMVGEGTGYADLDYDYPLNDEQYGVGFRADSDLTAACNEFFTLANESGLIETLLVKYGLVAAE